MTHNAPLTFVPNSSGEHSPELTVPENSCDSHIHIYTSGFNYSGEFVEDGDCLDYQQLQRRIGTSRTIVVNPRIYGLNNDCTLNAIKEFGLNNSRGVAVIDPTISDQELERLHKAGIRGVRFTLFTSENAPTTFDMVELVANRIQELGWHLQLHWTPNQIIENKDLLNRINCPIVIDHLGRITQKEYQNHPAYFLILDMLKDGNTWLKLSGAYLNSDKRQDNYSDLNDLARTYVETAPNRLVWGSDWPHPTERLPKVKPNDAELLDLLVSWVPDKDLQRKILVDNPDELYFFE